MANYITQSDIENLFGTDNVITWSNLDNTTTTADSTRITAAINYAEQTVHNRFRNGPYSLPFSGTDGTLYEVKHWCAVLAGAGLYNSRGVESEEDVARNQIARMVQDVEARMASVLAGQSRLAAELSKTRPTAPVAVTKSSGD